MTMKDDEPSDAEIRDELLRRVTARGSGSICPSEVARALAPQWRGLMQRVRDVAFALSRERRIDILRKGRPIEPQAVRGVIRLRLRNAAD